MLALRHSRLLTVHSGRVIARSLKTSSQYRPSFMASQYNSSKPNVVVVGGSYVGMYTVQSDIQKDLLMHYSRTEICGGDIESDARDAQCRTRGEEHPFPSKESHKLNSHSY